MIALQWGGRRVFPSFARRLAPQGRKGGSQVKWCNSDERKRKRRERRKRRKKKFQDYPDKMMRAYSTK